MTDFVIKDMDPSLRERLEQSAAVHGVTPEEEAKNSQSVAPPRRIMSQEEVFRRLDDRRKKYAHLQKSDSVDLIREDRDR